MQQSREDYLREQTRLSQLTAFVEERTLTFGEIIEKKNRQLFYVVSTAFVVVAVFVAVLLATTSDRPTIGSQQADLYVTTRDVGVVFNKTSRKITCLELRTDGLDKNQTITALISAAAHTFQHDISVGCVCAPMFGFHYRHLAVRDPNGSVAHMFNPISVAEGDKKSVLRESQRRLFPDVDRTVTNVRADAIRLTFIRLNCQEQTMVLRGAYAYCVQICTDLLDGVSVYDRNATTLG